MTNVQEQLDNTIQSKGNTNNFSFFMMARAGLYMPEWWSPARDKKLRRLWKTSDHLASAIYTMQSKMTSIPFRVSARDTSNRDHVREAEKRTEKLMEASEFGEGWEVFYKKWLSDYIGSDNGAFAEIIGPGDPTGPLVGEPYSIAHLDSANCQRTDDPIYPVLYDDNGTKYKLHFSRVMYDAQMPSPIARMNGVGFCSISRCVNIAQNLIDIQVYKQEKLGSRPHRGLLVTQGGLDPEDVSMAFKMAESNMDAQGMSRYSKMVVTGSASMKDADIKRIDLSSLPEGFDEETSTVLGMATIAMAFGVDARELFPAVGSSTSKADALLQHMKQRKKGPGEIMRTIEKSINIKYLPQHLKIVFDYQDDAQDRQIAEIRKIRADKRTQDANAGVINTRMSREQMLEHGEITRNQLARLELEDGRLMDGSSVLTLFYKDDPTINEYLGFVENPLNLDINDEESIRIMVAEKAIELTRKITKTNDSEEKIVLLQALAALQRLEDYYDNPTSIADALMGVKGNNDNDSFVDGRVRSDAPLSPKPDDENNEGNRERNPETDGQF